MKNIFAGLLLFFLISCANTQTELIREDAEDLQEDAEDEIQDSFDDYKSDDVEVGDDTEEPVE